MSKVVSMKDILRIVCLAIHLFFFLVGTYLAIEAFESGQYGILAINLITIFANLCALGIHLLVFAKELR